MFDLQNDHISKERSLNGLFNIHRTQDEIFHSLL